MRLELPARRHRAASHNVWALNDAALRTATVILLHVSCWQVRTVAPCCVCSRMHSDKLINLKFSFGALFVVFPSNQRFRLSVVSVCLQICPIKIYPKVLPRKKIYQIWNVKHQSQYSVLPSFDFVFFAMDTYLFAGRDYCGAGRR